MFKPALESGDERRTGKSNKSRDCRDGKVKRTAEGVIMVKRRGKRKGEIRRRKVTRRRRRGGMSRR